MVNCSKILNTYILHVTAWSVLMACSCFYLAVKPLFTWFSETCIFKQMLCKENLKKKYKKILSQTIAHRVWQYQMQSNNIQREATALWYHDKGGSYTSYQNCILLHPFETDTITCSILVWIKWMTLNNQLTHLNSYTLFW